MNPAEELKKLLLKRPALTLAAAESLTAGHVQARLVYPDEYLRRLESCLDQVADPAGPPRSGDTAA